MHDFPVLADLLTQHCDEYQTHKGVAMSTHIYSNRAIIEDTEKSFSSVIKKGTSTETWCLSP